MRARWAAVPLWRRLLAYLGVAFAALGPVVLFLDATTEHNTSILRDRGLVAAATNVRVHVGNAYRLDGVEVTFTTESGETVTTELYGVEGYGVNRPSGWQRPGPGTGYELPLAIRYDRLHPAQAMAVEDYESYTDDGAFAWTLTAAGFVLAIPAAVTFLRQRA